MNGNVSMADLNGIPINLISKESLEGLGSRDRVFFVLNEVKQGKVLILEMGLSAMEEASLIENTMKEIDHETFIGIEIQSYSKAFPRDEVGTWLDRLLNRKKTPRMAVIGPASLLRTIHKDGNVIQTMLVTREHVIDTTGDAGLEEPEPENAVGTVDHGIENEDAQSPRIKEWFDGKKNEIGEEPEEIIADSMVSEDEEITDEEGASEEEEASHEQEEEESDEEEEEEESDEEEGKDDNSTGEGEEDVDGEEHGIIHIHDMMEEYGIAEGGN